MTAEITLDNAIFESYPHALLAILWYGNLSEDQQQQYIDSVTITRGLMIIQFINNMFAYLGLLEDQGMRPEFSLEVLSDLAIRIHHRAVVEHWYGDQ